MAAETRLAVIGHPVSHSRSPRMHRAALDAVGLEEWSYDAIDVAPDDLARFVAEMPRNGFRGVNVTIPHKSAVLPLCARLSPEARAGGSVNTLLVESGEIGGETTDGMGLLWALGPRTPGDALIIGAGGAARAAAATLGDAGWGVSVTARRRDAAMGLGFAVAPWPPVELPELVVNATPVGQSGDLDATPLDTAGLRADLTVVDLAYRGDGEPTALCVAAAAAGAQVVDGIDVLVGQGILAFELFTGETAPVAVMQAAARAPGATGRSPRGR